MHSLFLKHLFLVLGLYALAGTAVVKDFPELYMDKDCDVIILFDEANREEIATTGIRLVFPLASDMDQETAKQWADSEGQNEAAAIAQHLHSMEDLFNLQTRPLTLTPVMNKAYFESWKERGSIRVNVGSITIDARNLEERGLSLTEFSRLAEESLAPWYFVRGFRAKVKTKELGTTKGNSFKNGFRSVYGAYAGPYPLVERVQLSSNCDLRIGMSKWGAEILWPKEHGAWSGRDGVKRALDIEKYLEDLQLPGNRQFRDFMKSRTLQYTPITKPVKIGGQSTTTVIKGVTILLDKPMKESKLEKTPMVTIAEALVKKYRNGPRFDAHIELIEYLVPKAHWSITTQSEAIVNAPIGGPLPPIPTHLASIKPDKFAFPPGVGGISTEGINEAFENIDPNAEPPPEEDANFDVIADFINNYGGELQPGEAEEGQ